MENNNKIKVLISFLIGGTIGGAVALLFAPKPGRELRTDISQKTKDLIEEGKNSSEYIWTGAKEKVGNVYNGANEFVGKVKKIIVDETNNIKNAVQVGYKTFNEERKSGEVEHKTLMTEEERE